MSRGLCVLAALAILAGGCASRRAVDRLGSDVGRLRSELAEMRVAQEVTSRDLANVTSQLQALDVRTLGDEVARLTRRADAADSALAATQTKVEALATQPGSTPPSGRPATSPVPAPMSPDPAVMSPVTNGALAWKVSSIVIVTAAGGVAPASGADASAAIDATANRRSSLRFIGAPLRRPS